ncbi:MAG TPA: glycosyltransferase family 1 protein [Rhizomicrobium sp.]|nr:glycosyltransferase family 1 protein [Rhizomicrobium sp.]
MTQHIILDLSRLLWRAERFAPTGIDRVELAYARHLIATVPDRLSFSGWWGRMSLLPPATVTAMIAALDRLWSGTSVDDRAHAVVRGLVGKLRRHAFLHGEKQLRAHAAGLRNPPTYLLVSHYRLHRPQPLMRLKRDAGTRFIFLVHDLIPILLPGHVPPGHDARHRRRMETVMGLADHVIVNSAGTGAALERLAAETGVSLPIHIAPLGLDLRPVAEWHEKPHERPYFVCLSTIEPRKNHRLLLRVWRCLAASMGDAAPRLCIVGRRGWKSAGIVREIHAMTELRALVEVHENLPDRAVASLLKGARALINPSFAEGFGLPVAEALALGVPVICSDLDELREVGGAVPEFLDPHQDEPWRAMIADYADTQSSRRGAQIARLQGWRAPTWDAHFARVMPLLSDGS